MPDARGPVFLERRSYRRRRMADFARLLPVIGLVLLMVPLLWTEGRPDGTRTSHAIYWIFGVWAGLVVATGLLARGAEHGDDAMPPRPQAPPPGPGGEGGG